MTMPFAVGDPCPEEVYQTMMTLRSVEMAVTSGVFDLQEFEPTSRDEKIPQEIPRLTAWVRILENLDE